MGGLGWQAWGKSMLTVKESETGLGYMGCWDGPVEWLRKRISAVAVTRQ